jgi:hypothetical protein
MEGTGWFFKQDQFPQGLNSGRVEREVSKIIFDPIPRVDGIDTSGDPLSEVRSDIYLLSGRRRRAAFPKEAV